MFINNFSFLKLSFNKMRKITNLLLLLSVVLAICLSIGFVSSLTGSIGNAKMVLYPKIGLFGETIEKYILVKNVNNVQVNISLEVDEDIENMIELLDTNFILEPGEEKKAYFNIIVRKAGQYEERINVFFNSVDDKKTGVALASTIIIFAEKKGLFEDEEEDVDNTSEDSADNSEDRSFNFLPVLLGLSTLVLFIILLLILLFYKRKKDRNLSKVRKRSIRNE
jgi:amino acid transporter